LRNLRVYPTGLIVFLARCTKFVDAVGVSDDKLFWLFPFHFHRPTTHGISIARPASRLIPSLLVWRLGNA
jgi:hypothetical protein